MTRGLQYLGNLLALSAIMAGIAILWGSVFSLPWALAALAQPAVFFAAFVMTVACGIGVSATAEIMGERKLLQAAGLCDACRHPATMHSSDGCYCSAPRCICKRSPKEIAP